MRKVFLVHGIVEIIGGIIVIFKPEFLLGSIDHTPASITVSKLFGILAFAFGIIGYLSYKYFDESEFYRKVGLVFMAYHLVIGFQSYAAFSTGIMSHLGAMVIHFALAGLFFLVYLREGKK